MHKYYKHKIFKKYNDEIWGLLLKKKSYNYVKKTILLNYKDYIKKKKTRLTVKYKFFKFFRYLYTSLLKANFLKRKIYLLNFIKYYYFFFNNNSLKFNNLLKKILLGNSYLNKNLPLLNDKFNFKRTKAFIVSQKFNLNKNFIRNNFFAFSSRNINNIFELFCKEKYKKRGIYNQISLIKPPVSFLNYHFVKYNYLKFYRVSRFLYIMKKRLNLRRQKEFFYCVHIAAPEKKKKKWSLFGLRNIYYKKMALFFGFIKPKKFINLYKHAKKLNKNAMGSFFSLLEGRLETFLFRVNFLPSVYFIKRFILYGNVFVNNNRINHIGYKLKNNEIVSINKNKFIEIYKNIKYRLKKKSIYLNYPKYVEADYKLLVAMLIKHPSYGELTRPFSFELYTNFLTFSK